jgi:protein-L-isoaspartate(D-aspartate) O-methyltransferase
MNLQDFEQARYYMIEQQVRPWQVSSPHVLALLSLIRREDFVPPAFKAMAFADLEISLPGGQHMLSPKVQARLLQDAGVQTGEKVLEIGTGSGYMTAILASLAQRVLSLELVGELVEMARDNLQKACVYNAEVRQADGAQGAPADGPFDVILLGGSVSEVPANLLAQLKLGGRLVAIVGDEPSMHTLRITRTGDANFKTDELWDFCAEPLLNFPKTSSFKF